MMLGAIHRRRPVALLVLAAIVAVCGGAATAIAQPPLSTPIIQVTHANLPATPAVGSVRLVTDLLTAGDCTAGSGSVVGWCRWSGSAWESVGDGGGSLAVLASGPVGCSSGDKYVDDSGAECTCWSGTWVLVVDLSGSGSCSDDSTIWGGSGGGAWQNSGGEDWKAG